jgi:superfamily II DNA or RNA helicase
VDEAHHCLSDSYQKRILDHFPTANILGVTATPDRGDMKNLGEFFDSKAYEYSMTEAIREGYLCPIKAQMIPLELDIGGVGISKRRLLPQARSARIGTVPSARSRTRWRTTARAERPLYSCR